MQRENVTITFNLDKALIRFNIVADEWPVDLFTKEIGIIPTEAYKKGDPFLRGNKSVKRFETVWSLEKEFYLRYEDNEDEKIIEYLFEPLKSKVAIINEYRKKYKLTCLLFIHYQYYNASTPGIRLSPNVISFANSINAMIDVYIDNTEVWVNETF